ncbi:ROK family transcriptional regulator [Streptomyces sp. MW-W600-10]|uniref:ROK family transcriptional regulator n=1 Tax=Streptomyces sp. MW-W600-10 TaxID=2829819 RepID=UPI001C43C739|nr:ROK family transcriptional regulator [Streptomyces sp. MW-W600-10]MBV7245820.1 ROK family transcriptional regulator [Streptomyces sp. MW-W600-10]
MNDRSVLGRLLDGGAQSASHLSRLVGLSKPTVYLSLARLESVGLVAQAPRSPGLGGRVGRQYHVVPDIAHAAGVHLTPRRVSVAVSDATGTVTGSASLCLQDPSADTAITAVRTALGTACTTMGTSPEALRRVLIGVPTAVDPSSDLLAPTVGLPGWDAPGFPRRMAAALGTAARFDNDINLAALAELRADAGQCRTFITMSAGEGVGMAFVTERAPYRGATGRAGSIHGLRVRSQTAGQFDLFSSLDEGSLLRQAEELGIDDRDGPGMLRRATDPGAGEAERRLVTEYAERVARGLAVPVSILDPELVVLRGSLLAAGGEELRRMVDENLACFTPHTPRIVLSGLGEGSVLAGALHLAVARAQQDLADRVAG